MFDSGTIDIYGAGQFDVYSAIDDYGNQTKVRKVLGVPHSMLAGDSKDCNGDSSRYFAAMDIHQDPFDLTLDEFPTLGLVSKAVAEDNPNF